MDKRLKNFLEKGIEEPGKAVEEFESAIANFIGRKYGIATDSATSALHLSLISLGIGKDDKVIIPSFVCVALLNAIKYVGAIPAVVDVEEDFNISVEKIERYLKKNKKVKAIIVPHMFGKNAKIEKIKKFGIPVIEDFTFTIGSKYKGKMSGKFGDISVCSFYYSKVLNAQKGGIFLTDNKNIYEKAKYLSFYDKKKKYEV
ncbi:MAG TPA: aminotransferase class I/II-fold pyridoxal phosphate-dependent enzyme [Firmicutes bacterium]|nr:aminotransferase class I/II-fold pyridoxal phosphate-dependent enzyme [Bacillota bacterium]